MSLSAGRGGQSHPEWLLIAEDTLSPSLKRGQPPLSIQLCATMAFKPEHKDLIESHRDSSKMSDKPRDSDRETQTEQHQELRDKQIESEIESQRQI